ncbi:hypothetical protein [Salinicola salarius]|uniref:hypothetical protein n=1 Tax=Salinicola salarius TaxID=430457 RepID=UPI00211B0456|nr:hypothetical protein [Salinicola salarius]
MSQGSTPDSAPTSGPQGRLQGLTYSVVITLGALGLLMAINQTFSLWLLGFKPLGSSYLYYLIGLFLAAAFLCYPARSHDEHRVAWYDWLLALASIGSTVYLGLHGMTIITQGWDFSAPAEATWISALLLVLVLEGVRRCGGWPLMLIALVFGSYPCMPIICQGFYGAHPTTWGERSVPMSWGRKASSAFPCRSWRSW